MAGPDAARSLIGRQFTRLKKKKNRRTTPSWHPCIWNVNIGQLGTCDHFGRGSGAVPPLRWRALCPPLAMDLTGFHWFRERPITSLHPITWRHLPLHKTYTWPIGTHSHADVEKCATCQGKFWDFAHSLGPTQNGVCELVGKVCIWCGIFYRIFCIWTNERPF